MIPYFAEQKDLSSRIFSPRLGATFSKDLHLSNPSIQLSLLCVAAMRRHPCIDKSVACTARRHMSIERWFSMPMLSHHFYVCRLLPLTLRTQSFTHHLHWEPSPIFEPLFTTLESKSFNNQMKMRYLSSLRILSLVSLSRNELYIEPTGGEHQQTRKTSLNTPIKIQQIMKELGHPNY